MDFNEFYDQGLDPDDLMCFAFEQMLKIDKAFHLLIDNEEGETMLDIKLKKGGMNTLISVELSKVSLQEKLNFLGKNIFFGQWIQDASKFIITSKMWPMQAHFCVCILMMLHKDPGTQLKTHPIFVRVFEGKRK